MTEHTEEIGFA